VLAIPLLHPIWGFRHEVVDQLGKLAILEDGVDRNLAHARRLDRRTTRLNE